MFCINQTTIHAYLQKAILAFVVVALLIGAFPHVTSVFAETELGLDKQEDAVFPVSDDREPTREMWIVATAYSSDPAQTDASPCTPAMSSFDMCTYYEDYGIENTIATNFLPLGTQVKFPELYGDKIFVVRDRMNARYNGTNRIDFWVGSEHPTSRDIIATAKNKARGFGVKQVKMEIYSR
ncbi:MAG: hypothetical protein CO029_01540 [Candidatus Magasanikbacteria bacterium CG_4_9_14_0_2_um_filter_41_10]|uniref:3D domain-containing protein n=1 Tax=Candidatus Magasanikbacteria bacterium CG_4_10_14_0_2_um_filter_41_31 TaxID=1974639 RepID=A0A2M7V297_9BACT|nr:MAG: hypothetical protein AUJ37_00065 [Candidatus Magasanikbacteria bacterium CG1_02_41_34]PIZ92542.1 MAG: hypothetical protein COX83_04090 [Candidatus Magasanikbacteria bacterium CG_4_10_14_0_2_um_filter_41_31]PJC53683.1 MAG: hypothetical protein CO029_01540 [Candidatus Magasanikbacteria bacterium CG_4_9_14_0_2_um_filter_41_10]